jgi:hypothetical protein
MKYILTCFLLLNFCLSYGQEPAYTPMRLNYQFRGIKVDSLFLIPSFSDTTAANSSTMKNVAGAMIRTGNDFWMRNSTTNAWLQNVNTGDGSSPSVSIITDVLRKANTDTIQVVKSLGLDETPVFAFRDRGFDTLRRRNDSVFAVRWGVEVFQFKDSTGGGGTDSPDRINGTATGNVNAQMGVWQMRFNGSNTGTFVLDSMDYVFIRSDSIVLEGYNTATAELLLKDFKQLGVYNVDNIDLNATSIYVLNSGDSARISAVNKIDIGLGNRRHITQGDKYEFKDFDNTFLRIDTFGNFKAGNLDLDDLTIELQNGNQLIIFTAENPMEWTEPVSTIKSQVKTGYAENSIDLTSVNYDILVPGLYVISVSQPNQIKLPDAANWKGQSFQIVNGDFNDPATISAVGGSIFDRGTGNAISSITAQAMIIIYSDGTDWYGFEL